MHDGRPLTIVQILPALDSGGVERCTLDMARALVAAGHRSIVISSGGRLVEALTAAGSEHITMPVYRKSPASLLQVRPLRRLLREIKPDIMHARSRVPAWIAWLALRKLPIAARPRFVTTVHGLNSVSFYSAIMTRGEAVIAISETVREYILSHYPSCPPEHIQVIYEGIDPADFPWQHQPDAAWLKQWRRDFPELAGKRVLALPGRLSRIKGHDRFVRLIQAVRYEYPDVHGLIIGGVEPRREGYAEELHSLVKQLGLSEHISFTGQRDDMPDVMSQCDLLFSLTTKPETFGRTVLEGLRLGKPVIGWDKGGVGEILGDCFPWGAVPDGDERTLVTKTLAWLREPVMPVQNSRYLQQESAAATMAMYRALTRT